MAAPVFESVATASETGFGAYTVVVTKPTGTASGDLLFGHWEVTNGTGHTLPSGWTLLTLVTNATAYDVVAWKIAGGSEGSSYTLSYTTSSGERAVGAIGRISGADGTTPVNASASNSYTTGSSPDDAPSVTTTVDDCLLVLTHGHAGSPLTNTVPSGATEQWSQAGGSSNAHTKGATKAAATAGATGTNTWTVSGFDYDFVLRTIAIAPSGGGSPPPPPPPATGSMFWYERYTAGVPNV